MCIRTLIRLKLRLHQACVTVSISEGWHGQAIAAAIVLAAAGHAVAVRCLPKQIVFSGPSFGDSPVSEREVGGRLQQRCPRAEGAEPHQELRFQLLAATQHRVLLQPQQALAPPVLQLLDLAGSPCRVQPAAIWLLPWLPQRPWVSNHGWGQQASAGPRCWTGTRRTAEARRAGGRRAAAARPARAGSTALAAEPAAPNGAGLKTAAAAQHNHPFTALRYSYYAIPARTARSHMRARTPHQIVDWMWTFGHEEARRWRGQKQYMHFIVPSKEAPWCPLRSEAVEAAPIAAGWSAVEKMRASASRHRPGRPARIRAAAVAPISAAGPRGAAAPRRPCRTAPIRAAPIADPAACRPRRGRLPPRATHNVAAALLASTQLLLAAHPMPCPPLLHWHHPHWESQRPRPQNLHRAQKALSRVAAPEHLHLCVHLRRPRLPGEKQPVWVHFPHQQQLQQYPPVPGAACPRCADCQTGPGRPGSPQAAAARPGPDRAWPQAPVSAPVPPGVRALRPARTGSLPPANPRPPETRPASADWFGVGDLLPKGELQSSSDDGLAAEPKLTTLQVS